MQITLSDYQQQLLLEIYEQIHKGDGPELNEQECCEIALDILLNSYESIQDDAQRPIEKGKPIDATTMRAALEQVTSPNLSTEFEQPNNVVPVSTRTPSRPFAEFKKEVPENKYILLAEGDELMEQAVSMVLSQIPKDQWDLDANKHLLRRALEILAPP